MIRGHITYSKIYATDVSNWDLLDLMEDLSERIDQCDIVVFANSVSDLEDMFPDLDVEFIVPEKD